MDQKISEFPVATGILAADLVPIVTGGANKTVTAGVFALNLPNLGNKGITKNAVTPVSSGVAIPVTKTLITLPTASTAYTLADGTPGQEITLVALANSITVTPAHGSALSLDTNKTATLIFIDTAWVLKSTSVISGGGGGGNYVPSSDDIMVIYGTNVSGDQTLYYHNTTAVPYSIAERTVNGALRANTLDNTEPDAVGQDLINRTFFNGNTVPKSSLADQLYGTDKDGLPATFNSSVFVQRIDAANTVYGTDSAAEPTIFSVLPTAQASAIALRTPEGQVVAETVSDANPSATTKDLVNRGYATAKFVASQPLAMNEVYVVGDDGNNSTVPFNSDADTNPSILMRDGNGIAFAQTPPLNSDVEGALPLHLINRAFANSTYVQSTDTPLMMYGTDASGDPILIPVFGFVGSFAGTPNQIYGTGEAGEDRTYDINSGAEVNPSILMRDQNGIARAFTMVPDSDEEATSLDLVNREALRLSKFAPINTLTASRDLAASDNGAMVINPGVSDFTVTVPDTIPAGFSCECMTLSTGKIILVAGENVTIFSTGGGTEFPQMSGAYQLAKIQNWNSTSYFITGWTEP